MRELKDSDLFNDHINVNDCLKKPMTDIVYGIDKDVVILNSYMLDDIKKKIIESHKDKTTAEIGNEIMRGNLVLIYQPPGKKLSDQMPFFSYTQNGVRKVVVNMSSITRIIKGTNKEIISYEMTDAVKAYSLLYGAYLYLKVFDARNELTPGMQYDAALVWACMFNKPIFDSFGMSNQDRNDAFTYFAMKFFLIYILECSEDQANKVAGKFIKNHKNDMILYMEEQIDRLELKPFSGMVPFMRTLFNNEVTQIKGVRVANVSNQMNVSFYIQKFFMTYGSTAILSLCTMPYFAFVVIAAYQKSRIVNDKAFDRIFSIYKREANALVIGLSRE